MPFNGKPVRSCVRAAAVGFVVAIITGVLAVGAALPVGGARHSCGSCCFDVRSAAEAPAHHGLDLSFYAKYVEVPIPGEPESAGGLTVVSSSECSDAGLLEGALTIAKMIRKRPDLAVATRDQPVHFTILAQSEVTTDVPEYAYLGSSWDWTRGLGATRWTPVSSCAEENLLCLSGDTYVGENICIHETAHTLQGSGGKLDGARLFDVDDPDRGTLDAVLRAAYDARGDLWAGTYAATNHEEYWAETVQSFFDANRNTPANTRAELVEYDEVIHDIIAAVFDGRVTFSDGAERGCPAATECDCDAFECPTAFHDGESSWYFDSGSGSMPAADDDAAADDVTDDAAADDDGSGDGERTEVAVSVELSGVTLQECNDGAAALADLVADVYCDSQTPCIATDAACDGVDTSVSVSATLVLGSWPHALTVQQRLEEDSQAADALEAALQAEFEHREGVTLTRLRSSIVGDDSRSGDGEDDGDVDDDEDGSEDGSEDGVGSAAATAHRGYATRAAAIGAAVASLWATRASTAA